VAYGVNDDLVFGGFVKDEKGIGRGRQAPDRRVIGACANERVNRQKTGGGVNARLNTLCALRGVG
jgi:hypothetical protein